MADIHALIQALRGQFKINMTYTKVTTGETKTYVLGIYEIREGEDQLWGWVDGASHIRQFKISSISSVQVLSTPFVRPEPYPIILNGEILYN
jgi:predicted DNA-binding transcriptional regulator YafY